MAEDSLSTRMLWKANTLFCDLYQRFQTLDFAIVVDSTESGENGNFSVWPYGSMAFAKIRRNLVAMDLLIETKTKQLAEKGKVKTRLTVKPTEKGFKAYREGLMITVANWVTPGPIPLGLGLPYADVDELHDMIYDIIKRTNRRVAKYRLEEWEGEFLDLVPKLICMRREEAEHEIRDWTLLKISSLPTRITKIINSLDDKSMKLDEWMMKSLV